MSDGFYIDVSSTKGDYIFYYNVKKAIERGVNINVRKVIGLKNEQLLDKVDTSGDYAKMGSYDFSTGTVTEINDHFEMRGISMEVNKALAQDILDRAIYYCPKDTGYLASTLHLEDQDDGSVKIVADCPYAWYVHEFTWKKHKFPERSQFLAYAAWEVMKQHGINLADWVDIA
jgi:hypothetical protein